jgi:parvulin-like peptidyl-prolyl isomerase
VSGGIFAPLLLAVSALVAPASEPPAAPAATPAAQGVVLDRIAAVVGDDLILESEVRKLAGVGYLPREAGEADEAYRDRVLASRVVEVLRDRQLRKTGGIEPRREEVEARVAALEARVVKERGESLDGILSRAGATRDDLTAFVKRGMALESFVRERLSPAIKTTDAELRAYYDGPFREEARVKGLSALPPFEDVSEQIRELVRERKLNAEIERWTEQLRAETRVLIYRR